MAKLAPAQEPSMEEILASIRRIITDEESSAKAVQPAPAVEEEDELPPIAAPAGAAPVAMSAAQVTTAEIDKIFAAPEAPEPADDVLELSEAQIARERPSRAEVDLSSGPVDVSFADEMPAPAAPRIEPRPGEALLSAGTDAAVTAAFNSLAGTILSSQARTLEDLVKDMLRPLLKAWLDNNLPPLVERLVREEIERVSRGRR